MTRPSAMATADFTIADVLAWARTKPAGERYDFCDARTCALAQFGRATKRKYLVGVANVDLRYPVLYNALNPLEGDYTFGELVARLEALCPAEPVATPSEWTKADAYMLDIETVPA